MRPVSGISTASSASDGIVCTTPVAPRIKPSVAGRLAARMPSGMPMTMLAASERKTSPRCSSVRRAKSGPKSLLQKSPARRRACARRRTGRRRPAAARESSAATAREILAFEFGGGVHPAHRRIVDRAFELARARPRSSAIAAADRRDRAARRRSAGSSCDRRRARSSRTCRAWRRSSRCRSRRPGCCAMAS